MEKVLMDKESRNMRKRIMWGGGQGAECGAHTLNRLEEQVAKY